MEGFNDVWANILNGDILNISESISEPPSLNAKQFGDRKADLAVPNQLALDISAITNNDVNKTVEKLNDVRQYDILFREKIMLEQQYQRQMLQKTVNF